MHFHRHLIAAAVYALAALPLAAQELGTPEGDILLTIDGAITETNDDGRAVFDRAMLEALGPVTFETETTWTEGVQTFTGVELATLLEAVGATGDSIAATAINDYAVDIPREDWVEGGPIVAYLRNGEEMPVRDKGPLWVVYPFDASEDYQTEVIYSRSIWQLDRITVAE
ncbi:molybdopterin-dependent oxidoreductase [Pseudoroseicyclus tamaricis]|uniref:Molybdopterin-dependent oxidoreductase n=1 Tax=Pseudoroseicyclus tamaricis TaxID=2705421 RepID=A0A6B2JYT8_9RHOB|nr:molybdopterin-dependent oxidoreductase [Pseudoroseicyclus tamaricis]NDV00532.1 molybdopterin-dependent oxidoreductase [Pseudoroseicyclus tamaricis]